jgi:hypothetical protein
MDTVEDKSSIDIHSHRMNRLYNPRRRSNICGHVSLRKCYMKSLKSFVHAFSIGFSMRACLSLLLRIIAILKTKPKQIFNLKFLLSEKHLKMRVDAVRLGLFFGIYTGCFNILNCLVSRYFKSSKLSVLSAGFISGCSILVHPKETRRTISLYVMARFIQCLYNDLKRRGKIKPIWNGDALLFALSSAQVMYSYVMRPETLPDSYWNFIVGTGPISKPVLNLVKDNNRNIPINEYHINTVTEYINNVKKPNSLDISLLFPYKSGDLPSLIGCNILHPQESNCYKNWLRIFMRAFKQTFPLYTSLTFVPMLVLSFFKLMKSPFYYIGKGLFSAARSSSFLGLFCTFYQMCVCNYRKIFTKDNRYEYYIAGFVASFLSILIEKKSRRSELALYTMPRAMDSLFLSLVDRKYLYSIPHGDVLLFCLSMSGIMYYNHKYPETLSSLVNTILRWLFRTKHKPSILTPPNSEISENDYNINIIREKEEDVTGGEEADIEDDSK